MSTHIYFKNKISGDVIKDTVFVNNARIKFKSLNPFDEEVKVESYTKDDCFSSDEFNILTDDSFTKNELTLIYNSVLMSYEHFYDLSGKMECKTLIDKINKMLFERKYLPDNENEIIKK